MIKYLFSRIGELLVLLHQISMCSWCRKRHLGVFAPWKLTFKLLTVAGFGHAVSWRFSSFLPSQSWLLINPFHVTGLFLYPLKTSENQRFSYNFRGYRKRPVEWNRLTGCLLKNMRSNSSCPGLSCLGSLTSRIPFLEENYFNKSKHFLAFSRSVLLNYSNREVKNYEM